MSDARVAELVERAFDYRGYVTLERRDGSRLVGYVYERGAGHVELLDEAASQRVRVPLEEIADVAFTGEDAAAKSQRSWERRKGTLEPVGTSAWGDWDAERPALILVALETELRGVARALGAKVRGEVARGRLGGGRAVAVAIGLGGGAQRAVVAEKPRVIVSCGFSGALQASLAPGRLLLASSVREEGGESLAVPEALLRGARQALEGLDAVEGELVCATQVSASAEEKRALAGPGRLAVDLESWSAARAAQEAGIPWLALRAVLDPLEADLPAFTREAHQSYLAPALRYALGGPRRAAELIELALRARTAKAALERGLLRLAPLLAAAGRLPEPRP